MYLGFPKVAGEPPKQLKGFGKVMLNPGEEKTIQIPLQSDDFEYWDEKQNTWTTAPGPYQVMLGSSSRDIVWTGSVTPTPH